MITRPFKKGETNHLSTVKWELRNKYCIGIDMVITLQIWHPPFVVYRSSLDVTGSVVVVICVVNAPVTDVIVKLGCDDQ